MIVAVGGSAGALEALRELVGVLPAGGPPIVVVLHLSKDYPSLLPSVLRLHTELQVVEAIDKLVLAPGTIVVAPPDYHLLVERELRVALSRDPAVHFSRPAIDPLFESVARAAGPRAVGVLLTGANEDGAAGLHAIHDAGGRAAVQDPGTARAPDMPSSALDRFTPEFVGSPLAIGHWLGNMLATESR